MPDPVDSPNTYIRPAVEDDAFYLAERLRQADLDELKASSNHSPLEALLTGFHSSTRCFSGVHNKVPFIIFGACPVVEDVGCVWGLGSDDIHKARMGFLRLSNEGVEELQKDFPLLFNYVDKRNELHIRWLKWMKFKFINLHQDFGVGRLPFYEFVRITDHV